MIKLCARSIQPVGFRPLVLMALLAGIVGAPAPAETLTPGNSQPGAQLFQQRCALCHADGSRASAGGQGPSLSGVVGRKAASSAEFPYTKALRASNLVWNAATLDQYLAAPSRAVPGTSMPLAVPDASERRDLIAYLFTLTARVPNETSTAREQSPPRARGPENATSDSQRGVFADWRSDRVGVRRHITRAALPAPFSTSSVRNSPVVAHRPAGATLHVPAGFTVRQFASGLEGPRVVRVAPNGDVFVAETRAGRIRVLRAADGADRPSLTQIFAKNLDQPFGIAFYPPAQPPQWVYVANNNSVVRFAYRSGDVQARRPAQVVVARLSQSSGGHTTRDIAFSKDGARMFVSVGSASNVAERIPNMSPDEIRQWEATHGIGAAWGNETRRAAVLVFDPDGRNGRIFATGIRNCVGLAVNPTTGDLWCSTNERDALGDDLVPDHATRVRQGAFYGWPWYYIGSNEDPRHKGKRPDLAGNVATPDVLFQPHSASLEITFYDALAGAAAFPPEYRGDGFVAFHGSWNRSARTGHKVVRIPLRNGVPTGEYEDFLIGFVIDDDSVWGRPVGVAVARDGALLVSEDGNGTLWRIAYIGDRGGQN